MTGDLTCVREIDRHFAENPKKPRRSEQPNMLSLYLTNDQSATAH